MWDYSVFRSGGADKMPGGYGEFGHDVTNPIPTNCIPDSYEYLENLQFADVRGLTCSRHASTCVPNIRCNIDI